MSNSPLFTILVAAHQTAPYLHKALDSVLAQTCGDFECMVIVEESTDDSLAIAQEYARRDSRFQAISLPRSGSAAVSRNYGIDHARGEYLVFLDGDDWLENDLLNAASEAIGNHAGLDVFHFGTQEIRETADGELLPGGYLANLPPREDGKLITGHDFTIKTDANGTVHGYAWLNICRVQFLRENRLCQNAGLLMEDFEWSFRCQYLAKSVFFRNLPLYVYRRRENSVTTTRSSRLLFDSIRQFAFVQPFIDQYQVPEAVQRCWANRWLSLLLMLFFHPGASRKHPPGERIRARNLLMSPPTLETLRHFSRLVSRPKRFGVQLFLLSRHVGYWLPWLYFRLLYYPLALRRRHR